MDMDHEAACIVNKPQNTGDEFAAKALANLRQTQPAQAINEPQTAQAGATVTKAIRLPRDLQPLEHKAACDPVPSKECAPRQRRNPAQGASKVSLLGWRVDRCKTLPEDTRATASGLALVVAFSTLANPYGGFTGGHKIAPQADVHTAVLHGGHRDAHAALIARQ